jgi:hypothetical protein
VQRLAESLVKVQPEVRQQLAILAERVAQKAAQPGAGPANRHPMVAKRPKDRQAR